MGRIRALGLAAAALALATAAQGAAPPRPTGGLAFGSATLVDPLRTMSSAVLHGDSAGTLWATGRGGGLLRSTDGGDSFRSVTRPPVGPGSADVVTAGGVVVVAAEEGGAVSVAGSGDGGATWRRGGGAQLGAAARPWLAADGSTVFLTVATPAGTEILSAHAGDLAFLDAGGPGPETPSVRCGRPVFDPARRMLHLACARGNLLELTIGRVEPGQATGISFATIGVAVTPAGPVGGPLPSLAVDALGDPYVVWIDAGTSTLYAARPGSGGPVQINGAGADVAALPAAVGGAPGSIAVAYLGAAIERDPNALPDTRTDPRGAAAFRWYGFAALVTRLDSGPAAVVQQRTTAKPVAFGRVCTTCPTDPIVGDTVGAALEPGTGALRIALPDASQPSHAPQSILARQLAGPTAIGQSISKQRPENGVVDGADHPQAPQLDLTKLELQQPNPATLRARMTVASPALAPPPGAAAGVWMTRFQILSRGQAGEAAYRTLYAAAIVAGGEPRFVAGEIVCDDACTPASTRPATGRLEGGAIVVDVDLAALSATIPIEGDLLYNVSGFTFGGDASGNPVAVLDSLASFDYRLDQRIGPTTGRGRRITLRGTIPVRGGRRAAVTVDVRTDRTGTVAYRDARARVLFRATRITRVTVRRGTVTIAGVGLNGTRRVSFVATLVDRTRRADSFGIRLSSGYRSAGRLLTGSVRIR